MATIVMEGDSDFRTTAYDTSHLRDERFLRYANERAREFESSLTGAARRMYDALPEQSRFTFDVEACMERSKRALALSKIDLSRVEEFVPCGRIENIQRPPREMQAYILAQPTLWHEWQHGRLQGYDLPPPKEVRSHFDNPFYQQVMVGRLIENPAGEYVRVVQRFDVSVGTGPNVRTLTTAERTCVMDVWQTAMRYHAEGHDVTSPAGGMR